MQITDRSRNKLLSLLLRTSQSSFLQIVEYQHKNSQKYQSGLDGDLFHARISQLQSEESFVIECEFEREGYSFSASSLNEKLVKLECSPLNEYLSENKDSGRKIKSKQKPFRFEIWFFNAQQLPHFVHDLASQSENITDLCHADTQEYDGEKAQSLLSLIAVVLDGLLLVEQHHKITNDSLTQLRSRTSLQQEIDQLSLDNSVALCMIHCIDFQQVNRKFGQAQGDQVLQEIAHIISEYTREDDVSGRFGGALFGIAIEASHLDDGHKLALKLQHALQNKPYLNNAIRLHFNIGLAFISLEESQLEQGGSSSILINRTEQALKAAQGSELPSIVQWEADKFKLDEQAFNYLGGIFTPDNVTNYRNMLLLWDISSIIADEPHFAKLLKQVIERLAYTFEFNIAGVVSSVNKFDENYAYQASETADISDIDIRDSEHFEALQDGVKTASENAQHVELEESGNNILIIPLGNKTEKCFFVAGNKSALELSHDSVMLFIGFARQIGKSLRRSQLEDELNKKLEQQNAKLAQELLELKAGMQSSALVYRSSRMQKLIEQTQRAAQSDTTVLITGESGTGKEKLINALHSLGPRNSQAMVIVDCGSIPETLIESELFGHVKGAFTGAQSENKGKIQAAANGLLVLDEIGELPLSMQPKLLRFVQEKQYTPVGSNQTLKVDVKIVAVTNRDLAFEVSQGKFRKDLFYRLNVVNLQNPPLRERPEDIDLLIQHFLSKFASQFEIEKKFVSKSTVEKMKAYYWPGNIRELENKLMQATLLTTQQEITFRDLQLEQPTLSSTSQPQAIDRPHFTPSNNAAEIPLHNEVSTFRAPANFEQVEITGSVDDVQLMEWEDSFCQRISQVLEWIEKQNDTLAIGNIIESTLLFMAYERNDSHSKVATLLNIPVSTARRRLLKPKLSIGKLANIGVWQGIIDLLIQIIENDLPFEAPVELVKHLVAKQILLRYSTNMGLASELMGVSEPTMYKLRKIVL
ncbi:sigma 54-interacting transcriptional regulator [Glaciecola sp. 2405UD65-10]|uniref:sigma 54-interacting transcriptional regulator n=1 Tax=Glaciecola sp. 2405UD65-10 TaxID=3397244 RepID=UPI003B594A96